MTDKKVNVDVDVSAYNQSQVNHLTQLRDNLPEGLPVPPAWLRSLGISKALTGRYLRSGWLARLPGGAYWKPIPTLSWTAILYSAQQLGLTVHAGELTALSSHGLAHYQALQKEQIQVYLPGRVPTWLAGLTTDWQWHHGRLFEDNLSTPEPQTFPQSMRTPVPHPSVASLLGVELASGLPYPVYLSTPERAAFELAAGLTTGGSWDTAYETFSGLTMLRPDLVRSLLLACRKVVVKRLFLHLAARSGHAWLQYVDLTGVDLGKGDRQVVMGGQLDPVYRITVPRVEDHGDF